MRRLVPVLAALTIATAALAAPTATGRATMNAYFAPGFADTTWQKDAVARVMRQWKPPATKAVGKKLVLISTIGADGALTGLRVNDPWQTGDPAWDGAAVEAIKKASPFAPLPQAWKHPALEVHWHFETARP